MFLVRQQSGISLSRFISHLIVLVTQEAKANKVTNNSNAFLYKERKKKLHYFSYKTNC